MAAGGGIGNITIVVHENYLFSRDNTDSVRDILRERQEQLISYLQNVTVLEFSIAQSNFSEIYGVPNPNATNLTIYNDEFAIARRLSEQDVIVPPFPEECIRINSTLVTATAEVVVPYNEHAVAYGVMRYLNQTQLTWLTSQSTRVIVCSRDMTYTDRILIPAPSPPPPEPPSPSPPDDFNPPPSPPYLWTTSIAAPGALTSTGFFFLFSCCCLAVAGRRAGGLRNKMFGTGGMAMFPHDDPYEMDLQTRHERHHGILRGDTSEGNTLLQPVLGKRVDQSLKAVARKPSRRGGELTFTFGRGPV